MIALHACDTATDVALHHALRAGVSVILAAPCCHKQLRGQLQPPSALRPLFRHGVHLGQEAKMVTDGMRALLQTGWEWDRIAKAMLAIAGMGAISFTLAFKSLRGRVKRN